MTHVRRMVLAGALGILAATAATPHAQAPTATAVDPDVLRLREAAWRAWFAGDAAALEAMLPAEFIGIGWQDGPFSHRGETLAAAKAFRAGGGRLVRLEFPETQAQRFGDVVVLYGRFTVVMAEATTERSLSGRLTEVFVRRDGRWVHPGWHLDALTTAP